MYQLLIDGKSLYYPGDAINTVTKAELETSLNDSGALNVTVPASNPEYNNIIERKTEITVLKNDVEIWSGEVRESNFDIKKNKKLYVVGELSYLADSIQPQARFQNATPEQFFRILVDAHNSQVEDRKKFTVGVVTVTDPNNSIYRYTNREDTLECIRTKLCEPLNGYLRIRKENGNRYIDLVRLQDYGKTCQQPIQFGKNLLKFAKNIKANDIATCVIPLGARLETSPIEGLEAYTDISSVNDGKDYIESEEAIKNFGYIRRVVKFDDITEPSNLKEAGEKWLAENQFAKMGITVDAVDLSEMKANIDAYELGDYINVKASPYGLNAWYYLNKRKFNLLDVKKNTISVGDVTNKSYTKLVNSEIKAVAKEVPNKSDILAAAQNNSSNLIKLATNGYIYLVNNSEGRPMELLIMDTPDITTAKNLWRFNSNGIGYSSTGYKGEYNTAWTMDGHFVADAITVDGLVVGKNVTMGPNAKISWENVTGTDNVATTDDIPTKVSDLKNDSGYTTMSAVEGKGYQNSSQVTQITKDTVTTQFVNALNVVAKALQAGAVLSEAVEAQNLKITGGVIQIETSDNEMNFLSLKSGIASLLLKPYVLRYEKNDGSDVTAVSYGGCSTTNTHNGAKTTAEMRSGGLYFGINGSQKLAVKARGDGYADYTASTGHDFRGIVVLTDGGVLGDFTPITSDKNRKKAIKKLDIEKTAQFVYSLIPRQFSYKKDADGKLHHGLIAQEVKEAMGDDEWNLYVDNTGNERLPKDFRHKALVYDELITDLIATVQSQNKRITKLEKQMKGSE